MSPESLLLAAILSGVTLYALLAGADFGAGVWEFNTALKADPRERELLYRAIGPVWEANHVWLIFVLIGLHTAFPPAFAALCRALWVPLLLGLAGIVFRGAAFAFRHAAAEGRDYRAWDAVFAFASTAAPFFLGAAAGALASGRLPVAPDGSLEGSALTAWIRPQALHGALFGTGVCAFLTAVYLCRELSWRPEPALLELWRRRALWTGLWVGALSAAGIAVMALDSPELWASFRRRAWPLVAASSAAGILSLLCLWKRRFTAAAAGAVLSVAAVIWGWGVAQYPLIVPPAIDVDSAKAPPAVLNAALISIGVGTALLVPSIGWLFYLFKWRGRT
ncbi:MAG: cytochrome d ubiquinol oxidase subunit II [Planctomycetes bacterium]|nr:cytochrome d ubiquinol oxidase subunit II [Planctomycetota bacterium]